MTIVTDRALTGETYSVEQASAHAVEWCRKNPAWVRICDLPDGVLETLSEQWHDLSARKQKHWGSEEAYDEWARKRSKVAVGFVTGKGEFYADDICKVPLFHNLMTVFRVGREKAREYRAAKGDAK